MRLELGLEYGFRGLVNVIKWHEMETSSMEKMEKTLGNSPFYAMKFGHRITFVAPYSDTLTCFLLIPSYSKHIPSY